MNHDAIVLKFFEKGKLLTPKALEILANTSPEVPHTTKLVLNESDFVQTTGTRVLKSLEHKPTEVTTEDFMHFYKSKYEKMSRIILTRLQKEFVSLNKIPQTGGEIFIIGMVKDAAERDGKQLIEFEDMTTTIQVVFHEKQKIELDDVVAARVQWEGKTLAGKQILYPDIPLRQPTSGRGKGCFVSDLHITEAPNEDTERFFRWVEQQDFQYLFIAGGVDDYQKLESLINTYARSKMVIISPGGERAEEYPQLPRAFTGKNITSVSNPAIVEAGGLKVLMVHNFSPDILKKRYMGRSTTILPEDYLTLDDVPDIVHHGQSHQPHVYNYKSITIVNSGSLLSTFRPVIVDFGSREIFQATVTHQETVKNTGKEVKV
ncbi:MAG: metallophosphoesterase family protein [Candidatus Aenigmarchaeota archaeon]|nr:metallophosphoesterase family protein [Candidatus Aenigmarchaeota archaeon]